MDAGMGAVTGTGTGTSTGMGVTGTGASTGGGAPEQGQGQRAVRRCGGAAIKSAAVVIATNAAPKFTMSMHQRHTAELYQDLRTVTR